MRPILFRTKLFQHPLSILFKCAFNSHGELSSLGRGAIHRKKQLPQVTGFIYRILLQKSPDRTSRCLFYLPTTLNLKRKDANKTGLVLNPCGQALKIRFELEAGGEVFQIGEKVIFQFRMLQRMLNSGLEVAQLTPAIITLPLESIGMYGLIVQE